MSKLVSTDNFVKAQMGAPDYDVDELHLTYAPTVIITTDSGVEVVITKDNIDITRPMGVAMSVKTEG